ncbi:hypothetical protein [Bartonella sp. LJL80]
MGIGLAMRVSVEGMNRQADSLYQVSENVASATAMGNNDTDIANDMTDMVMSEHVFKANFRVFQMADDVMAQIVNLKR